MTELKYYVVLLYFSKIKIYEAYVTLYEENGSFTFLETYQFFTVLTNSRKIISHHPVLVIEISSVN